MPEVTCPSCGNVVHTVCAVCNGITPAVPATTGVGAPPVSEETPSILKEYHYRFLRIFLSYAVVWCLLIALVVFFVWLGAQRAVQAP